MQPANNVLYGASDRNETGTNKKLFGRFAITVSNEDVKDIVVPLNAGATLTGSIVTEGAAQQVPPATPASLPAVQLVMADSDDLRPYTARSNADGTFELHDVPPERYRVHVTGSADGAYVKSIRFGNEDITGGVLDLTSGNGGGRKV